MKTELEKYAELVVKTGLNIQKGQRLLIGTPVFNSLTPFDAAPLVREITKIAYDIGASFVDVMWGDDLLVPIRLKHAQRESLSNKIAEWSIKNTMEYFDRRDSILFPIGQNPVLLENSEPQSVFEMQQAEYTYWHPVIEKIMKFNVSCSAIPVATPGWAAKMFPDLKAETGLAKLWDVIYDVCRVKEPDPVNVWQKHFKDMDVRKKYLNCKQYKTLQFTSPKTKLTIDLPDNHIWKGGRIVSSDNVTFAPNIPTEEIFTMPKANSVNGIVHSTKPLSFNGLLIEDFQLRFLNGKVVEVQAAKGEASLNSLLATDEGAKSIGEVALVPNSSPISKSGHVFYNLLIDENAASHLALGQALRFNLINGESMSNDEFVNNGGNNSKIHVDFMIGSEKMDVLGLCANGSEEPIMHQGEWVF